MNNVERDLIRWVCEGNIIKAQRQARAILTDMRALKDQRFRDEMLWKLNSKGPDLIELPSNVRELLVAENQENFPVSRFLIRKGERSLVDELMATVKASERLSQKGIRYLPTALLYGASGGGKTMLARYIAHKAEKPFIYMQFSNIVSAYLGSTQSNLGRIFEYARRTPCVLCLDEIDAIGMARGQQHEVGEMDCIVIALMQELDRMPNNIIVVGTTNRFDRLDAALVRRFTIKHEVLPLSQEEAVQVSEKFFRHSGYRVGWVAEWIKEQIRETADPFPKEDTTISAAEVVNLCTKKLVEMVINGEDVT